MLSHHPDPDNLQKILCSRLVFFFFFSLVFIRHHYKQATNSENTKLYFNHKNSNKNIDYQMPDKIYETRGRKSRPLTANLRWRPFSSVPHVSDRLELHNNNRASWILHPGPSESDVYSDVVQEARWNDLLHTARLLMRLDTPLHGNNARGAIYVVYYASVATHTVFENIKMAALRAMSEEKCCSPFPCFFIPWKKPLNRFPAGIRQRRVTFCRIQQEWHLISKPFTVFQVESHTELTFFFLLDLTFNSTWITTSIPFLPLEVCGFQME